MRAVMQPVSGTFELRRQRHSSEEPAAGRRPKRETPAGFEAVAVAAIRSSEAAASGEAVERGKREVLPLTR